MKIASILTTFVIAAILSSCSDSATEAPNTLGGNPNIPINTVGNNFGVGVTFGGTYLDIHDTMYVTKNDNGLVTYKVWADLSKYPMLKAILPPARLDSNGNLNTEIHLKVTSEGIQDFRLADSDFSNPFTIVKYDCKVGDSYTFTPKGGAMVMRSVIQKSATDDFSYGFYLIKTNTTNEEPVSDLPGVKKIKYITNHKFGLVQIVAVMTDNTELRITLFPNLY